ncbi:MAG: hypothetical protein F2763_00320 [Actinobacteria bacterium]|uniref:Unannotated protein n=1 Tax=freshwater metagenome TaxID=449393 RepID=A0A6J6ZFX0_9ZZZZ|nr:hypothetical protein [Actinomycetota bacterium]
MTNKSGCDAISTMRTENGIGGDKHVPQMGWAVSLIEGSLEVLAEAMTQAISENIQEYRALDDPTDHAEMLSSCIEHLRVFELHVRTGQRPDSTDFAFVGALAARRAQEGIPLHSYLATYRVAQLAAWRHLRLLAGERGISNSKVLDLSTYWLEYIDVATGEAAQAFLTEQERLVRASGRERRDVLDLLLSGSMTAEEAEVRALSVGLTSGMLRFAVVVVRASANTPQNGGSAGHVSDGLAREFFELESLKPFVVDRFDEIVAIVPLSRKSARELAEPVERVLKLLNRTTAQTLMAGIGLEFASLTEARLGYLEATRAIELMKENAVSLALADVPLMDYLPAFGDQTAHRLVPVHLAKAIADDRRQGGVLIETLMQYEAACLSVTETAAAMYVHPNTVYYRLARLSELTGVDVRRFTQLVQLLLAVKLVPFEPTEAVAVAVGPKGRSQQNGRARASVRRSTR